jgi:hypothetical protein
MRQDGQDSALVFFKTVLLALLLAVVVVVTLIVRKSVGLVLLYVIGGPLLAVVGCLLTLALIAHAAETYHHIRNLALDRKTRERHLREPTPIHANEMTGSYPMLLDDQTGRVLDPDRGLVFDANDGLVSASPRVHDWAAKRRLIQSLTVNVSGGDVGGLLAEPERQQNWPTEIPLKSVVTEPDIKALTLGVTVGDDGQQETVKADMGKLVHIAVGGSSGWGKSVFLRSLGYQLALSQTPVDLAMVDLESATLAPFARCERLLYPVADTEDDALAVLGALLEEMERRKALYATHPGVDSLAAYNAISDESLSPLVAIIDEATALLSDKSVESTLRTLTLRARKYGLWLIMAGQDWTASSLDTAIRNQLSSRIQFKAMSGSQSRVLLQQGGAEELAVVGRALVILPGKELFTLQAPFVNAKTIMADCSDGGPRYSMPEMGGVDDETTKRIRSLAAEGVGLCAICDSVFGYHNSAKTAIVKGVLGLD